MTRRKNITVCVKCLRPIEPSDESAEPLYAQGEWWWACGFPYLCAREQGKNRENHRREIGRRLAAWRKSGKYTHLVVVKDKLGYRFGYGNYYIGIAPGRDPKEVARHYETEIGPCHDRPMLVVESILPVATAPDPRRGADERTCIEMERRQGVRGKPTCRNWEPFVPDIMNHPCILPPEHIAPHHGANGVAWDDFGNKWRP